MLRALLFLIVFVVVLSTVAVFARVVPWWSLPIAAALSLLFFVGISAVVLRTSPEYGLSEKGFLELMKEALLLIPKILSFRGAGKDSVELDDMEEGEKEGSNER